MWERADYDALHAREQRSRIVAVSLGQIRHASREAPLAKALQSFLSRKQRFGGSDPHTSKTQRTTFRNQLSSQLRRTQREIRVHLGRLDMPRPVTGPDAVGLEPLDAELLGCWRVFHANPGVLASFPTLSGDHGRLRRTTPIFFIGGNKSLTGRVPPAKTLW